MAINFEELDPALVYEIGELERQARMLALTEAVATLVKIRSELFENLTVQQSMDAFNTNIAKRDGVDLAIDILRKIQ
jgi:hypothetical protein